MEQLIRIFDALQKHQDPMVFAMGSLGRFHLDLMRKEIESIQLLKSELGRVTTGLRNAEAAKIELEHELEDAKALLDKFREDHNDHAERLQRANQEIDEANHKLIEEITRNSRLVSQLMYFESITYR